MVGDYVDRIRAAARSVGRKIRLMEVCGTHTHQIARAGLRSVVGEWVELVSGPGCPVCVTSQADIERMLAAADTGAAVFTFGDMLRVPGRTSSLQEKRAEGASVHVVYSPTEALLFARRHPDKEVILIAVGFETTAPAVAATVKAACDAGTGNFSVLVSHKMIVPAMDALMRGGEVAIDGFITPGHVSTVIGSAAYEEFASRYHVPCVATGFEPLDILEGIAMLCEFVADRRHGSFIQYTRAVRREGNPVARKTMMEVFVPADGSWRGLGIIPRSALVLRERYAGMDASVRFDLPLVDVEDPPGCRCGDVLKGLVEPTECGMFGTTCTPDDPVGPCMVSSEGSCAARFRYG